MNIETIEIAKLELQLGDILLVRIPANLNAAFVDGAIKETMKQAGINVPVLIGPKDIDFQIIRTQAKPIDMTECSDGTFRTGADKAAFEAA